MANKKEEGKETPKQTASTETSGKLNPDHVIIALINRFGPLTLSPSAMKEAETRRLGIDVQDDGSVALEVT